MRLRGWAVAGAVGLAVLVAACGGDDDDGGDDAAKSQSAADEDTTTTAGDDGTTTTTLSPEEEVLAAYQAANDALFAANDPPNPDHPDLLATHSGEALELAQNSIEQLVGQNVSFVGSVETHPSEPTITGDKATFRDCYVNSAQQVRTDTREPLTEVEVSEPRSVDVTLEQIEGTWKMTKSQELGEPCTPE